MKWRSVPDIELTENEKYLLSKISFNLKKNEDAKLSLEPIRELTESLLQNKAIPLSRHEYFTKPEYNIGGHGKSREDVFEQRGVSGSDIFEHPHFLKYLEYFVYGPDLPQDIIDKLKNETSSLDFFSGSDLDTILPLVKECVRKYALDPCKASEEFFKLAVECKIPLSYAESIRVTVRRLKV